MNDGYLDGIFIKIEERSKAYKKYGVEHRRFE